MAFFSNAGDLCAGAGRCSSLDAFFPGSKAKGFVSRGLLFIRCFCM